jgi:2-oxoglutarate ferredoxin oxidoreductase subunit alpha
MEEINKRLQAKYNFMKEEVRYELLHGDDADLLVVAYGLSARISHRAVEMARNRGLNVGLLRPITLYPYPYKILNELSEKIKGAIVVELNAGQMVEDVRLGVNGKVPVEFYGRMGGIIPPPEEVLQALLQFAESFHLPKVKEEVHA